MRCPTDVCKSQSTAAEGRSLVMQQASSIKLDRNRFPLVQTLTQRRKGGPFRDFPDFSQEIIREGHPCHSGASFQGAVEGIRNIEQLNYFGHVQNILHV